MKKSIALISLILVAVFFIIKAEDGNPSDTEFEVDDVSIVDGLNDTLAFYFQNNDFIISIKEISHWEIVKNKNQYFMQEKNGEKKYKIHGNEISVFAPTDNAPDERGNMILGMLNPVDKTEYYRVLIELKHKNKNKIFTKAVWKRINKR